MRFRYTAWDGSQHIRLDADRIFERLAALLSQTDDLDEALDRLMREGWLADDENAVGLDCLLEELRRRLQSIYDKYDLDHALDRHRERLGELVDDECSAVDRLDDGASRGRRHAFLNRLPLDVGESLDRLRHYPFVSHRAAEAFSLLSEDGDDVRRLAAFLQRHGSQFRGREQVGFDDALEIMEQVESIKQIEERLLNRDLDAIDVDSVRRGLGDGFADAIARLRQVGALLAEAGYTVPKGGRTVLSAAGARRIGHLALREIYRSLAHDTFGRHETARRGPLEIDPAASKPYSDGDPLQIDAVATVCRALRRRPGVPVVVEPEDLMVYEARSTSRAATVLLLDMSWSMSWEGRFAAAKKVALALECLMRTRYSRDYFAIVGFYTRAVELSPLDLPEVSWNMGDPFTNLQDGLRLATRLLERQSSTNKTMIVVTDGQPTAYFAGGRLFCEWPMSLGGLSTRATVETLREVERVTRRGIVINTFMLDDSPPLRAFVERMTRINRGRAFYTTPDLLGRFLLVDHVRRRRRVL